MDEGINYVEFIKVMKGTRKMEGVTVTLINVIDWFVNRENERLKTGQLYLII